MSMKAHATIIWNADVLQWVRVIKVVVVTVLVVLVLVDEGIAPLM
ncbi:hypothetical protein [Streptomyces sp. NPDC054887]